MRLMVSVIEKTRHLQGKYDMENADLIPGLPDDVGILCLARIPLCHRRSVSSVCRNWRNVFHEDRFWDARLELSRSEQVLLLWASSPFKRDVWFGFYPSTKTWVQLPIMPDDGRAKGHTTFAAMAGKLYVIGGWNKDDGRLLPPYSRTVSYFDFKLYQWRMAAPLNIPRCMCTAGVINDRLYVCGGIELGGAVLRTTPEVYNPSTQTWNFIASMTIPRAVQSSIAINNKFYVAYRESYRESRSGSISVKFEGAVYDPMRDEWSEMPYRLSSGLTLGWSSRSVVFDGKICVRSCDELCSADGIYENPVLAYNPSRDAWDIIHGRIVSEDDVAERRLQCRMEYRGRLVNIGETLYALRALRYGPGLRFEIRDLEENLVAAKSFSPRFVEDIQDEKLRYESRGGYANADVRLEYQLVTL